jgi:type III secretion system-like peptide-binding chaperone
MKMRFFGLRVAVAMALFASSAVAFAQPTQTSKARVEASLQNILNLDRPGQDGYATIWDGNKYVQCKRLPDRGLRCEAAGALMQPPLERVLTPERIAQLAALSWRLDPSFGNYVQTFPAGISTGAVAEKILQVLAVAYDADAANPQVESRWVRSELCPPRNGPTQNLAGMVNDAPSMAATAIYACTYKPKQNAGPNLALGSTEELIDFYGVKVTNEIQRLRVNIDRNVFAVFETGIGYVQCRPDARPPSIYCEAQSADSWEALASILTPERVARLHAAGFADPGRGPNYWKAYQIDQPDDSAIAREILTILHDVYGYNGQPALKVKTE